MACGKLYGSQKRTVLTINMYSAAYHTMRRDIEAIFEGYDTQDGAGVKLHRVFGGQDSAAYTDPFLLLDNFGSKDRKDYEKGFPWHPHRGIETVTYVLDGRVKHRDSTGVSGTIGSGEIQWMTAGSGIFHEEMPEVDPNGNKGMQLWVNLPKASKMQAPVYRNVGKNDAPEVRLPNGIRVKVVAGRLGDAEGPVNGLSNPIEYYHISMPLGSSYESYIESARTALIYVISGRLKLDKGRSITAGSAATFGRNGDSVSFVSEERNTEALLLTGIPLKERIAWYGPIVMNTREELVKAYEELQNGSFIKGSADVEDL